jgi:2'-5' RNA ligase
MNYRLNQVSQIPAISLQNETEYVLVVMPSAEVNEQIIAEKKFFYKDYDDHSAMQMKPFIKVAGFYAREEMEDTIIRWMHRIISMQESFNVMLNNYSGFPPHTIYARVQFAEPFKRLYGQLAVIDQYLQSNGCGPVNFSKYPHVTIAKKLQERVYEKAMLDYSQRSFFASFQVNEMILLKRRHADDAYRQVNMFGLTPAQHPLFD